MVPPSWAVLLELSGTDQTPPGERLLTAMALEDRVTAAWWARLETWLELRAMTQRGQNGAR